MNKIHLIGNLTRDPELSVTQRGVAVCNFSIAVNRSYKNSDGECGVDYFNCKAWRKLGDTVARYVKKGNKVSIVGYVSTGAYEDDNGNKIPTFTIVVEDIEFLTPNASKEESAINDKLQQTDEDNSSN